SYFTSRVIVLGDGHPFSLVLETPPDAVNSPAHSCAPADPQIRHLLARTQIADAPPGSPSWRFVPRTLSPATRASRIFDPYPHTASPTHREKYIFLSAFAKTLEGLPALAHLCLPVL